MKNKYIHMDVEVSDTVEASFRLDRVLKEIETEDLRAESKNRSQKYPPVITAQYEPNHILEWFDNPFVSDFDKMQVLNKIKDELILEIDYIKSNL